MSQILIKPAREKLKKIQEQKSARQKTCEKKNDESIPLQYYFRRTAKNCNNESNSSINTKYFVLLWFIRATSDKLSYLSCNTISNTNKLKIFELC